MFAYRCLSICLSVCLSICLCMHICYILYVDMILCEMGVVSCLSDWLWVLFECDDSAWISVSLSICLFVFASAICCMLKPGRVWAMYLIGSVPEGRMPIMPANLNNQSTVLLLTNNLLNYYFWIVNVYNGDQLIM